jgi:hypothetical protein
LGQKFCLSTVTNAIIFAKEKNKIFMERKKKTVEVKKNKFYAQSMLNISCSNIFSTRISQFEDQYTIQYGELRKLIPDLQNKNLAFIGYGGTIYTYFDTLREFKIKRPEEFKNINNYNKILKTKLFINHRFL